MAGVGLAPGDSNNRWRPLETFDDVANLSTVGDTMILAEGSSHVGHWRRYGGAVTLAELLFKFGEMYTAQEIFFWYFHAEKLVKKLPHPQGSPEVRAAAHLRFHTYGHYGHRN